MYLYTALLLEIKDNKPFRRNKKKHIKIVINLL